MLADPLEDFAGGRFCTPEPIATLGVGGALAAAAAQGDVAVLGEGTRSSSRRRALASSRAGEVLLAHRFELGDALVFASHKRHCVTPVASGTRRVLVVELWCGEPRHCAHRCEAHWGPCGHTRRWAAAERLLASDADP
jgi:hypothetical protein